MKLNVEVIKKLDAENKLDSDFFHMLLVEKERVNDLYSNESIAGLKWGEWDRTVELIERLAKDKGFFNIFAMNLDKFLVSNLFIFFPKYSNNFIKYFLKDVLSLPESRFLILLSRKETAYQIVEEIVDLLSLRISCLTPKRLLLILLAAFKHCCISQSEEVDIIDKILEVYAHESSKEWKILLTSLETRKSSIIQSSREIKLKTHDKKRLRCALVVSGQFRYPISNIEDILKKITDNSGIKVTEVFVASWSRLGGYCLDENNKFYRHLNRSAIQLINNENIDISRVMEAVKRERKISSQINCDSLINEKKYTIRCALNNEEDEGFSGMSNSKKMYYNNYLWVRELGENYFLENFDLIIKVRPDINILEFRTHLEGIKEKTVLAEEGYVFKRWGFGAGDQVLIGKPKTVLPLLKCYADKDVIDLLQLLHGKKDEYRGHINVGLRAWLNNIGFKRAPDFRHSLNKPPMISDSDIKKYLFESPL